ncbi:hypothetical protein HID58_066176 [Brassica napus]|uniref:Uncharacterized protein n=1 Tax=Brassica napus TaxID=3708 RepID=A0ABQ7ZFC7_BRANA|nr:hypothetical protein HID58_066176 [Brassica napus]
MAPKTRFAGKTNKEGAPEKKKKNRSAAEKKKAAAVKRRREAVKKKRDAAKKKTETAEKKRKQDSSSSESSSNPTKRRRTASSPEQHSDPDHSPAPSAELLSQDDREGTPSPSFPIEPQKAPTQTPSEAENPLQAPITSNNREDPNRESHSPEAAINNEAQRTIGSNNSDSNPPEAAIGSATIDNDAPRTDGEENMAVEPMRPVEANVLEKLDKMEADDGSDERLKMAVISSTLKPQGDELDLLYEIMDEGSVEDVELQDDSDKADIAVDGQEEERVCEEPEAGGEAGRESVKELELRLNKRMDDGFALRDETIRLLAARVKELEQDKIQRENWSFQFGEYETCEASGGKGREAAKEAYEVAGNEDEVGQKEGETEADKEGETEEGKTDVEDSPSTLQVMAEAAEKLEKEVDDKAAAEKAGDELAAAEKAASDKEKVGDEEETRPKRTHKPSRPLRSPYQKN